MSEAPATTTDSCAGCRFYQPRHHIDHNALARAAAAGMTVALGHCRRFPAPIARAPEDWCGEHRPRPAEAR